MVEKTGLFVVYCGKASKSFFKKISVVIIMNKYIKRILALGMSATMFLAAFSGCGKDDQLTLETTTAPETTKEVVLTDYNRLTGLDNLSEQAKGKRPVAVMINNIKASLPQYGIANADLMFECEVEGGITRMMAVYADYTKVPNVCSVRSCRYYFPILAYGLDAVYFCYGSNPTLGTPTLERLKIDYFDGNKNTDSLIFARDPNRLGKYSREHTAYLKGENLPEVFKKYEIRTDYKDGKDNYIFSFRDEGDIKAASSKSCDKINLAFSNQYYTTFTYDSEKKVYLKQHNGSKHMDSASGTQLSYKNVFVLETDVKLYGNGPLMQIDWKGGTGYYISAGGVKKIKWSKKSEGASIVIKDTKGKEVKVNAGNSYIGIIDYNSTSLYSQGAKVTFESPTTTAGN